MSEGIVLAVCSRCNLVYFGESTHCKPCRYVGFHIINVKGDFKEFKEKK